MSEVRVMLDGSVVVFGTIGGPAVWGALEVKTRGNESFLACIDREGALVHAKRCGSNVLIPETAAQKEIYCLGNPTSFYVLDATGTTKNVPITAVTNTNGFFPHAMRRLGSGGHSLGGTTSANAARHTVLGSEIAPRERCGEYPFFGHLKDDGTARWVLTGHATPAGTQTCGFGVTDVGIDSSGNFGFLARLTSAQRGFLGEGQSIEAIADHACVLGRVTKDGVVSWMLHPARPAVDGPDGALTGTSSFTNLFVDDDGTSYVVGYLEGKCRVGTESIDTGVEQGRWRKQVIAAAFDPAGKLGWIRTISSAGTTIVRNAAADAKGNVLVVVEIRDRAEIAGARFEGRGKEDVVLVALDREGVVRGTLHFGGEERDRVHAVAAGPEGEFWIAGEKGARTPVGSSELSGPIYVARLELRTARR